MTECGINPRAVPETWISVVLRSEWARSASLENAAALVSQWSALSAPVNVEANDLSRHFVLPGNATVLGGYGLPVYPGMIVDVEFAEDGISITGSEAIVISYNEIEDIQLSGGKETSGGGFIGGGFGLDGAAIGIAAAALLNAITTSTTIKTLIHVVTRTGELFLFYDQLEPLELRIRLSHAFTAIRTGRSSS